MLAADLHRKVTHENFSLEHEDLLTAEVFGALQYLPRSFLASVLAEAARRSPRSFEGIDPVGFSEECQFTFWPKYELVEESRRTIVIPDVVLKSPDRAVVIECKLGARLDEAQLVRELKAVRAKTPKSCVLAVTTGVVQSLRL